tara:strand:- start:6849 stop:7655 length:807 start_codon:yes stop_codon:yes gene_type:complete
MDDIDYYAEMVLEARDMSTQIPCLTSLSNSFSVKEAYSIAERIFRKRLKRGQKVVGRKIGFTNTTIWKEYNVNAPIWGPIYSTSVFQNLECFCLDGLLEPRIEPEIVFKLGKIPTIQMSEEEVFSCISHYSCGFEIVHSIFKNWKFLAADTVAAFALHECLIHGEFIRIKPNDRKALLEKFKSFKVQLFCDGKLIDKGSSLNILDGGPVKALCTLVQMLSESTSFLDFQVGEIISTGTLTNAFPIKPGEVWLAQSDRDFFDRFRIIFS